MFEIKAEREKSIIVIKASGVIQADDYEEATLTLGRLIEETAPTGLLIDSTDFSGWADGATQSLRLFNITKFRSKFQRIAILADVTWTAEITDFEDMARVPVRRFAPSDRQSAEDWLASPS